MKLETLPAAIQILAMILFASAIVAFVFAFLGIASTIFKAKFGLTSNNEKRLSQGEKWGQQNRKLNPFLLSPQFKTQRIFVFGGFSGFIICFVSLFVIVLSNGK
ncbi:hypothetical protein [Labrenzia sp. VG12]|uniref:hypothetical protein n=1 Tax=Labrenzia sp. VG12 TaxID=2021862 RepID=UPI000B8C0133|nr:hypothetical protein [Labrenzia sp. VG12]ASP36063.1 hypothetical protein CHH27_24740 [Labrenzia sp. VG12]